LLTGRVVITCEVDGITATVSGDHDTYRLLLTESGWRCPALRVGSAPLRRDERDHARAVYAHLLQSSAEAARQRLDAFSERSGHELAASEEAE
jgi:hypothetical protein